MKKWAEQRRPKLEIVELLGDVAQGSLRDPAVRTHCKSRDIVVLSIVRVARAQSHSLADRICRFLHPTDPTVFVVRDRF